MANSLRSTDVISVDRLGNDVILVFRDGRSAIFTSELLYSMLHQAQEVPAELVEGE